MNSIRPYSFRYLKVIAAIFIFSILFSKYSSAQQHTALSSLQFDHLNFSNSLSFNGVTSIIKDKYGFIWIATLDGLNRYDGISFKIYRHDARNTNSLASNNANTMTLDGRAISG